ncbi:MAG: FliM/FliN family flagellar motor switch protein [Phycisphaeraceae bacterium]|nr:FliM/FliN family flagellar motor switch protein [Phycisphaeraceae bacterium]MCW5762918.1 FliM/FliN family flagellar motor switch protein [Phycisphaeraceae bacterium]
MMGTELSSILRLEVPIVVLLAERAIAMGEVMSLVPGSIIELGKTVDQDLDLLVNNRRIGHGVAMKVGENYGVEVTQIGDSLLRINALGAGEGAEDAAGAMQQPQ